MDRYPRPVLFTMPWMLSGLSAVLVLAASIASFSFTSTLARLAGVPEGLAWLWPVVVGLSVAQIAYTYVMLARMPHERIKPLALVYQLLLVSAALVSVGGNVSVISPRPTELSTGEITAVVSVAPACLVCCVCGYVVLAVIIPARIEASIRDIHIRESAERVARLARSAAIADAQPASSDSPEETPWWKQHRAGAPEDSSESNEPEVPGNGRDAAAEAGQSRSK
ncbi:hypothetical protein ABZW96_33355 [Nocardia sp. NPDC004168]|uniref:hypothetical protein n=1 Tax=Nocardia sp. NPDC004168 TaxID=3154452 RepID=UPI0033A484D7